MLLLVLVKSWWQNLLAPLKCCWANLLIALFWLAYYLVFFVSGICLYNFTYYSLIVSLGIFLARALQIFSKVKIFLFFFSLIITELKKNDKFGYVICTVCYYGYLNIVKLKLHKLIVYKTRIIKYWFSSLSFISFF